MGYRFTAAGLAALALLCGAVTVAEAGGTKKLKAVIIDGQNNHNWRATTPVLKKALEASGRFTVDVATAPERPRFPGKPKEPQKPKDPADAKAVAKYLKDLNKYEEAMKTYPAELAKAKEAAKQYPKKMAQFTPDLSKYDVVVSNYNGDNWPREMNDQLERLLKAGKIGLVIVHAANNSFGGWDEYNRMIGMGWRGPGYGKRLKFDDGQPRIVPKGEGQGSGHRYTGPFSVVIRDPDHPVTKGMPREWKHARDELYDNMRGPIENVHVLGTAYSKGTKTHEPMIWTVSYGKGRVFHTPMGHDANAMLCQGFITTLQRGSEWAATGDVTIEIPQNFPTAEKTSTIKSK